MIALVRRRCLRQGSETKRDQAPGTIIMPDEDKLKLGKGAAFVKGRLKRLPQGDETWEADFQALPKPIDQSVTCYRGMVVTEGGGSLLSESQVHGRPSVNDLADAMRRPLEGKARRPGLVRLRGHHQWGELFPHLAEIEVGIEVSVKQGLPAIEEAYAEHLRRMNEEHRIGMVEPSAEQLKAAALFPAIDRWVKEYGYIEIGVQELFGFVTRALHEGGTRVDDDRADTLAEALAALEIGLVRWFKEQGVEINGP
jgi:hypothetical protein